MCGAAILNKSALLRSPPHLFHQPNPTACIVSAYQTEKSGRNASPTRPRNQQQTETASVSTVLLQASLGRRRPLPRLESEMKEPSEQTGPATAQGRIQGFGACGGCGGCGATFNFIQPFVRSVIMSVSVEYKSGAGPNPGVTNAIKHKGLKDAEFPLDGGWWEDDVKTIWAD